jgi:hypothetical protein
MAQPREMPPLTADQRVTFYWPRTDADPAYPAGPRAGLRCG